MSQLALAIRSRKRGRGYERHQVPVRDERLLPKETRKSRSLGAYRCCGGFFIKRQKKFFYRQAVLRVEGEEDCSTLSQLTITNEEEAAATLSKEEEETRKKAKLDALWKEMNQPITRTVRARTIHCFTLYADDTPIVDSHNT